MGCFSSKSSIGVDYDHNQRNRFTRSNIKSVPSRGFSYQARSEENLHNIINIYHTRDDIGVTNRRISNRSINPRLPQETNPSKTALFGEYRCVCGRTWSSRLSWQGNYQNCKRCKRSVYPHAQRRLRPSDISTDKENIEHPKELCQKCKQLGSYCGKRQKDNMPRRKRHASLSMF